MERENKKRGREVEGAKCYSEKSEKRQEILGFEEGDIFKILDTPRPLLGVFEFPWQKENLLSGLDDWYTHDDFYSSLVDSFRARNEFTGDMLCQNPALIDLPVEKWDDESWPWEVEETDGADCIWSCVLSQPLLIRSSKGSKF